MAAVASNQLNNLDTLRSYGSAGDELENVPLDYLRNLNRGANNKIMNGNYFEYKIKIIPCTFKKKKFPFHGKTLNYMDMFWHVLSCWLSSRVSNRFLYSYI